MSPDERDGLRDALGCLAYLLGVALALMVVVLFLLLTGCAPEIVFSAEPHATDCYLDHACLPERWKWLLKP